MRKSFAEFTRYNIGAPHDAVNPDNSAPFALTPPCQVLQLTEKHHQNEPQKSLNVNAKIIT